MKDYKTLLSNVLNDHTVAESRAGRVLKTSHNMLTWDMSTGFPALTGRRLAFKTMAGELACFVQGLTDVEDFNKRSCPIWNANLADFNQRAGTPDNTSLGPIYGSQWRNFSGVDQLQQVIEKLRTDPYDRRMVVSAWNPPEQAKMVLPPCHLLWQLTSTDGQTVDLAFYMRSADLALGLPFDIASYGLLLSLICHETGKTPGKLTAFLADCHIYEANLAGVHEYLARPCHAPPQLHLTTPEGTPTASFEPDQATLVNYQYEPAIQMGGMAV